MRLRNYFIIFHITLLLLMAHSGRSAPANPNVTSDKTIAEEILLVGDELEFTLSSVNNRMDKLNSLAQYFPEDALVYTAFRTDEATIDQIDGLVQHIMAKLPQDMVPPVSLRMLLDLGSQEMTRADFATGVRPWLGDSIAVGIPSLDYTGYYYSPTPYLIVIPITDRSVAESLADTLLPSPFYESTTINGYTVIQPAQDFYSGAIAIGDDVLMFGVVLDNLPINGLSSTLKDSIAFNETLALLPGDAYGAVAYINGNRMISMSASSLIGEAVGSQAIGLTFLDDRSIAMDAVANLGDLDQLGLTLQPVGTVDPAFAAHIPANASLVMHGTNFKMLYSNLLEMVRWGISMSGMPPDQVDEGIDSINAMVQVLTGLDMEQDILDWMTGDFVLFISIDTDAISNWMMDNLLATSFTVNPQLRERYEEQVRKGGPLVAQQDLLDQSLPMEMLPIGFGLVITATNPAKAEAFASVLEEMLPVLFTQNPSTSVSQQQIDGIAVTIVSHPLPSMGTLKVTSPLEIVIGANEHIFLIATHNESRSIFAGSGRLDTVATFIESGAYLLDSPSAVWYLSRPDIIGIGGGILLLGPTVGMVFPGECILGTLSDYDSDYSESEEGCREAYEREFQRHIDEVEQSNQQMMQLVPVIHESIKSIFNSGTISVAATADGNLMLRFVLTFGE